LIVRYRSAGSGLATEFYLCSSHRRSGCVA
jgi:hypothetical protein